VKRILYIGNNLSEKSKYHATMASLTHLLTDNGYSVICSSNKSNKIIRLFDMCFTVISNRNKTDYLLIDTFSTSNFYYALIISQLARLFSIKYVPILHGGNLPSRLDSSPFLSKKIFKNAYKNSTPSTYLKYEFKRRGFETQFIPNFISIEDFNFKKRSQLKPTLLWVRAFDKTYNPQLAIRVVALLKNEYPTIKLCMVGPDKDGSLNEVKQLAEKLNVADAITFTGVLPKEEWHELSKEYAIFMNTTNIDNMPVSILEAMALGYPIVSTNAGGLPYLISNDLDGMLVPVNDELAMSEAISSLIKNPEKATILSENARKKAETFDINAIKAQWLNLLT